jgi:gustatory receptor
MDLTTLQSLLRVGEILAITPSLTTTKKTFTKKCYDVAVLTVFTVGLSYSLYNRTSFYPRLNIFKLIIRVLQDLCLCMLSYYILVGVHFRKKEWSHLISNLKSVQTSKRTYTRSVIVAHLVYCPIILYTSWLWFRILKAAYFKNFIIELSQFYMSFFYNILIVVVLKMILSRYDHIKGMLTKQNEKLCVLKQCKCDIYRLKESVDVFNDIFGWPLFLIISYSVLRILYSFEAILRDSVSSRVSLLVTDIAIISLHLVLLLSILSTKFDPSCFRLVRLELSFCATLSRKKPKRFCNSVTNTKIRTKKCAR